MLYKIPTNWIKVPLDKRIISNIENIIEWCNNIIGKGKTITYTYFTPGDLYSADTTEVDDPLWIIEKDLNFAVISFKQEQHAFLFNMRWL